MTTTRRSRLGYDQRGDELRSSSSPQRLKSSSSTASTRRSPDPSRSSAMPVGSGQSESSDIGCSPGRISRRGARTRWREEVRKIQAPLGEADDLPLPEGPTRPGAATPRAAPPTPRARPHQEIPTFDFNDRRYFFRRERLLSELVARPSSRRSSALVGPSGSRKSSLLRAGLLPALADGRFPPARPGPASRFDQASTRCRSFPADQSRSRHRARPARVRRAARAGGRSARGALQPLW